MTVDFSDLIPSGKKSATVSLISQKKGRVSFEDLIPSESEIASPPGKPSFAEKLAPAAKTILNTLGISRKGTDVKKLLPFVTGGLSLPVQYPNETAEALLTPKIATKFAETVIPRLKKATGQTIGEKLAPYTEFYEKSATPKAMTHTFTTGMIQDIVNTLSTPASYLVPPIVEGAGGAIFSKLPPAIQKALTTEIKFPQSPMKVAKSILNAKDFDEALNLWKGVTQNDKLVGSVGRILMREDRDLARNLFSGTVGKQLLPKELPSPEMMAAKEVIPPHPRPISALPVTQEEVPKVPVLPSQVTPKVPLEQPTPIFPITVGGEAGQLNLSMLPGVNQAATQVNNVLDYLNQSKQMTPIASEIGRDLETLRSQNKADEILAVKLLKNTDLSPSDAEAIYHYAENKKEPLTPAQMIIYQTSIKPLQDERNALFSKIRNFGVPVSSEDYTPRFVSEKGGIFERLEKGGRRISQGGLLSKTTGSFKHRTMKVIMDENGNRKVVSIKNGVVTSFKDKSPSFQGRLNLKSYNDLMKKELSPVNSQIARLEKEQDILIATKGRFLASHIRVDNIHQELADLYNRRADIYSKYSPYELTHKVFTDKNGKRWTIYDATTKEIENETNLTYHKNILLNELVSYNKLRQIDRAIQFLEGFKESSDFGNVSVKFGTANIPEGWRGVNMPQFRGYTFEPRIADTLDKLYGQMRSGDDPATILFAINNFLRTSIFFNPLIHIPNITNHWAVNRGLVKFLIPEEYVTLVKTAGRAIEAVVHQNADYVEMLSRGANLLYFDVSGERLHDLMLKKMGEELIENSELSDSLSKALGYLNPTNLIKTIYEFSGRATWLSNDVATMQAVYEEMGKGITMDAAIQNVAKHIPDYRIPARVLDSKVLAGIMANPNITMFSKYHYGALKSYGEMVKSLLSDIPISQKTEILDKILMLGVIALLVYPQLDRMARLLTGDKNATFRRAGATTVPYNTYRLIKGKIPFSDYMFSIFTPSPVLRFGTEMVLNRELRSGRPIYGPSGEGIASELMSSVSPLSYYQRIQTGQMTFGQFGRSLLGITSPKTANFSDAEQLAYNINRSKGYGTMTHEKMKQYHFKNQLKENYIKTGNETEINNAVSSGAISPREAFDLFRGAEMTPLEEMTRHMSYEDVQSVMQKATPQEAEVLRPILQSKMARRMKSKYTGIEEKQKLYEAIK